MCVSCPVGTFLNSVGGTSLGACQACLPGSFSLGNGSSTCLPCAPGQFTGTRGSSSCQACPPGSHQSRRGSSTCVLCEPGLFGLESGSTDPSACRPCATGTYSTGSGIHDASDCSLCQAGHFSTGLGMQDADACQECAAGTVSSADRAHCPACGYGTVCPLGSNTPILCRDEMLACDGTNLLARPGYLPFLEEICTGAIPCPEGTRCRADPADHGIIPEGMAHGQTHFVVFRNGSDSIGLSCPGQELSYGSIRVDQEEPTGLDILFRLWPASCPAGGFLMGEACVLCPEGTSSHQAGVFDSSACQPCPVGAFAEQTGTSQCSRCEAGSYQNVSGSTGCTLCPAGRFQPLQSSSHCLACAAGSFTDSPGHSLCPPCKAGSAQAQTGATACLLCALSDQFSSLGDTACSLCGVTPALPSLPACPALDQLPGNLSSFWISVRGEHADECVGIGETSLQRNPLGMHHPVHPLDQRDVNCVHTLQVMGRPDLSTSWTTRQRLLRRPSRLRVLPYGQTVFPVLCGREGLSFLFTAQDERGWHETDLSGAEAVLAFMDVESKALLYWTTCDQLPRMVHNQSDIHAGSCRVMGFCPSTAVIVRVTLSWTGGHSLFDEQLLLVESDVPCAPSTSWLAQLELEDPGVPRYRGDRLTINLRVLNFPLSRLTRFRFRLKLTPDYDLVALRSEGAVTHHYNESLTILEVDGDGSRYQGGVLVQIVLAVEERKHLGVLAVVQGQAGSFWFTTTDGVEYSMLVRAQGFTCNLEGIVYARITADRIVSLVVQPSSPTLVHWRALQDSAEEFPVEIHALGVWNRMGRVTFVDDLECSPSSVWPVTPIEKNSCAAIRYWSCHGDCRILVRTTTVMTAVSISVLVPQLIRMVVIPASDVMSGRFQALVYLHGNERAPKSLMLDATPYLGHVPGQGVGVRDGEWTCTEPRSFKVGWPVLFQGECIARVSSGILGIPFLFTGVQRTGLSSFVFSMSALSPTTPSGTLLFVSPDTGRILQDQESVYIYSDDTGRVHAKEHGGLALQSQGMTARCVLVTPSTRVPVLPAAPVQLLVTLSATILVTQNDPWELLPTTADVTEAWLTLSDGTKQDVRNDPRLAWTSTDELDILAGIGVRSRTVSGNFHVHFSLEGVPCAGVNRTVQVHAYSMMSSKLVCKDCPVLLTLPDDPVSVLYPARFPSWISVSSFSVQFTLVDESVVSRPASVIVGGVARLQAGGVVGTAPGMAKIWAESTAHILEIPVVDRWVSSGELMCNGGPCVPTAALRLTLPGDGASLPPFSYPDKLTVAIRLLLFNGLHLDTRLLDGMQLSMDGVDQDSDTLPLTVGEHQLLVSVPESYRIQGMSGSLRVDSLQSLMISGPATLFQIHCSRLWEQGQYAVEAMLSSGERSPVQAPLRSDGVIILAGRSTGEFWARRAGSGWIEATFGNSTASVLQVQATVSSKYLTAVGLQEPIPSVWAAREKQMWTIHALLEPSYSVRFPRLLKGRLMHWGTDVPGVLSVPDPSVGNVFLLSDFYGSIGVSCVLRACHELPQAIMARTFGVNLIPSVPGQIDLGAADGQALNAADVGGLQDIPVYLFANRGLQAYELSIIFDDISLTPDACTPGEFVQSECRLETSTRHFRAIGESLALQEQGRILVGVFRGRVLLDTLSKISVVSHRIEFDDRVVDRVVYQFVVRLGTGVEVVPFHHPYLNRVGSFSVEQPPAYPSEDEPETLELCCDGVVSDPQGTLTEHFPTHFRLTSILLGMQNLSLDVMDPRLGMKYDTNLLDFQREGDMQGAFLVLPNESWEGSTVIQILYTHPGTLTPLQAQVKITLAEVERLDMLPSRMELYRIHCSPHQFQNGTLEVRLVLRHGLPSLSLIPSDVAIMSSDDPDVALPFALSFLVQGFSVGEASISCMAHGLHATSRVLVHGKSVVFRSFGITFPLVIRACKGSSVSIPLTGKLELGPVLGSLDRFLQAQVSTSLAPVVVHESNLSLQILGNTVWDNPVSHISVHTPACQGMPQTTVEGPLRTHLTACLSPHQPVDVEIELTQTGLVLTLVGQGVVSFYVHLRTDVELSVCNPSTVLVLSDCVLNSPFKGDLVLAGVMHFPVDRLEIAQVESRPANIWGFVESYSGIAAVRAPIVAGQHGLVTTLDPIRTLLPVLPVVDTAVLGRASHESFPPILQLMTGRTRLVDPRVYSTERELSIMVRVVDQYLTADTNRTDVLVSLYYDERSGMPLLPDGVLIPGGQRVPAPHVTDGWYAVQWQGYVPSIEARLDLEVKTRLSISPSRQTLSGIHLGLPFRECPRTAEQQASFRVSYRVLIPPQDISWITPKLVCRTHVAARRITLSDYNSSTGLAGLSLELESFNRIQAVHSALTDDDWFQNMVQGGQALHPLKSSWRKKLRQLALTPVIEAGRLFYVNDTADGFVSCPPGVYFSANGTYTPLPLHAKAGDDCYGLACNQGYKVLERLDGQPPLCVPEDIPLSVAWICVIFIVVLIMFVGCVLFCIHMARANRSASTDVVLSSCTTDLPAFMPPTPIGDDSELYSDGGHVWGTHDISSEVHLDDYSASILDDPLPLSPVEIGEFRR